MNFPFLEYLAISANKIVLSGQGKVCYDSSILKE